MSFQSVIKQALLEKKADKITREIARLGREKRKLSERALVLTNKREALLGQALSTAPHR